MSFSMPRSADDDERAEHGERNGEQHGERQRPALVLRGEDQEHHDDREHERDRRVPAGALLLERLAGPGDRVAGGQRLRRDFLDRRDRLARATRPARRCRARAAEEAVEAVDCSGPTTSLTVISA